jgi:hypothetical protein
VETKKLTKGKGAKNEMGDGKKSKKTSGTVAAPSPTTPKSKSRKVVTKKKNPAQKKNFPTSPAAKDNASNATSKKSRKKATSRKSGEKGQGKSAVARKWCMRRSGEYGRALGFSQT